MAPCCFRSPSYQGSIHGPLLFIDDVRLAVNHSVNKIFADNICLYSRVSRYEDCSRLQGDLSCVFQWSLKWQLNLNHQKCEAINISNKRFLIHSALGPVQFCGPRMLSILVLS